MDFLLPTGILIPISCRYGQTMEEIKELLWRTAENYPLYSSLKPSRWYTLIFVNRKAEQEECLDETQRLSDLQIYKPLFKVLEKKGDQEEKLLSTKVGWLIGKCLRDFDAIKDPEVNDFRLEMMESCKKAIEIRSQLTWEEKLMYCSPPDLEGSLDRSNPLVGERLSSQGTFYIHVYYAGAGKDPQRFMLQATPYEQLNDLLKKALYRVQRASGPERDQGNGEDYILKVCGVDEFLLGSYPLIQYKYIKRSICKNQQPYLALIPKSSVPLDCPVERFIEPSLPRKEKYQPKSKVLKDLWEVKGKFQVKVISAGNLNVGKDPSIQVFAGLYHGNEPLCSTESTRYRQQASDMWNWNEFIQFDVDVKDLPMATRLCLAIYAVYGEKTKSKSTGEKKGKVKKKREAENVPLAWVNQPLFDYRNMLRSGTVTLPCWTIDPEDPLEDLLNPIGTVMLNPNSQDCPSLMIQYTDYGEGNPVKYPDLEKVLEVASQEMEHYQEETLPKMYQQDLKDLVDKDQLASMFEMDKEFVWRFRMYLLQEVPHSLPKLLNSVKWNQHRDVAVLQSILQAWRPLPPEAALELLDYAYQDPHVRAYAVHCLEQFSDTDLLQYLLQLCQALKYENHLHCALASFLLERAWKNKRIGHYLFWNLRAEMDSPEVSLRFGLMLEAYVRGSVNHMMELQKQMDAMGKMRSISELLHSRQYRDRDKKDKAREAMRDVLSSGPYKQIMCNAVSTLNPKFKLGEMKVPECRFFDSKMRPLLLVYENPDPSAQLKDIRIMFKKGDDLRQDMLTLQIINIMDNIWQQAGLDLRLLPYGCLSTGMRLGFIEVVRKSETIANIQKERKKSKSKLWDSAVLYAWLKEKNPTDTGLQKAAEAFCLSCAGYCVATFVLGIGDRHSDNIMITDLGQLFHVDFGHFLGNFKVKFGVRRERVPFVLPHDFEIIIDKHFGFDKFVQLCEDAYLILRRKASLFINLLAMMLQTGIPELKSMDDLNYVRVALALGDSEKDAKDHFHSKLQEARKNAWSTSLNWYIHGLAKDNRQ